MTSERITRRIEGFLDQADEASVRGDWPVVVDRARAVLAIDENNRDALAFLKMAEANLGVPSSAIQPTTEASRSADQPASFVNGRYEVKRFLGEGGKKRVYLAHDTLLDRDVAFALIKAEGLDDVGRQRITREAQTMGRLGAHPHIVSVFDLGMEGEQPYIVTELMGGGDVEGTIERAEDHRLPIEEVLRLGDEVCQGLSFAHQHGVVHRDLKPGNVWLTADGRAKIGDFGLAVALDRSRMTQAGMMVGTASYMPPEQAMGGAITERSDLYSLGAMLYEAVTGRPPFLGDEAVAVIGQHLNTAPVAPSWHRPDCPPGLEALVLRLLEKDPQQRPASADEVREALGAVAKVSTSSSVAASAEPDAASQALYQRTFVGREAELGQLTAAFDRALSGEGAVAMVVGEPGIGKTTLTEQLATYATLRGGRALWGHCYEEGSLALPYLAFVEALRGYVLGRDGDALRSELGTGAGEVARIVSEVRDRVQVSPAEAGEPEEQRYRLMTAVTTFLRNASAVQPLLVVLEDLHDADRGTLDLLLHLARNLQGARLLVVGSYRDVEVDRAHPLSATLAELRRVHSFLRVPLRGLSPDEVHRMMSNIRGQDVSRSRAEAVWRQTEGNPLFVQEVLRYLVEAGLVVREGDRYVRTDGGPDEAGIPEGLRDVIGKRLTRLSPETNQILAVAAVQGRDFRLDVLQAVANQPAEAVERALEEAAERAIVEERTGLGTLAFRFTHAFFRQTLYEELFAARRLRLHQEVGRALEAAYGRRAEDHAAELAEHFAQSTDPADLRLAVDYGELAAQRAMSVFDYADAARFLGRTLEVQELLDPDDRTKKCDLLLAFGGALLPAGDPQRVFDEVAPVALRLGEELHDRALCFRACYLALRAYRQHTFVWAGANPDFQRWAQLADRYAEPQTIERVHADYGLAAVARAAGRDAENWTLRAHALEVGRKSGDEQALIAGAHAALEMGAPSPSSAVTLVELARDFADRALEGVSSETAAQLLLWSGRLLLNVGERDRAEAVWRRLAELAERTRAATAFVAAGRTNHTIAMLDGRLEDAVEMAGRQVGSAVGRGSVFAAFASRADQALVLLGRGEEALVRVEQASLASGFEFPHVRATRAQVLAHSGRIDEAREVLAELMTTLSAEMDAISIPMLASLLDVAVQLQDRRRAALLTPALAPTAGMASMAPEGFDQVPARLLGGAAALLGKPDEARAYYHQALEVAGRIQFRPETALTHLELAELLFQHYPEERADGLVHLDFAIEEFRTMKMRPALERALRHRELLKA